MKVSSDEPAAPATLPFADPGTPHPYRVNGTSRRRRTKVFTGDAREIPLPDHSVDLVVTSPPYWGKRDYSVSDQIGQESTPKAYVSVCSVG